MLGGIGAPGHALLAAVAFAASQVTIRRGLVHTSVIAGVLISLSCALVSTGVFVIINPPGPLDLTAVILFGIAGLAAPGISRWASASGIHRLGPSVAVPITQGARPLLSVAGAVLLLNETFTLIQVVGLAAIICGGWELSRIRKGKADQEPESEIVADAPRRFALRPGIAFPLIAALSYATSDLVLKEGLDRMNEPSFAAFASMVPALLVWLLIARFVPRVRRSISIGRDFGWLILSGGLIGIAIVNLNTALDAGDVSVVVPIVAAQPLAVFVFSKLLLKEIEVVHPAVILASLSVIAGTIAISV